MLKTKILKDEPLLPGDRIELHFKFLGPNWRYLHATELALLEYKLKKKHPLWKMRSWDAVSTPDKLVLEYEITEPDPETTPQIQKAGFVTGSIIALTVIGGGVFLWLSLEAIYKITDSPAGQVALAGTGAAGFAFLIIAVILILQYRSRKE